ncbi:hypothetical protein MKW94_006239 [Papaver nudicaule]|uniref:Uncharacterized protein n=1 Tax=Papaver nudicaule TaxID=74823 RepID=A0AA41RR24_PAPNU|nr:hypothetical protein [Papaver nudicaule]
MASGNLLILSLLLLFTIGSQARPGVHFHPCKTLFISSFTISTFKPNTQFENPNNFPNQNPTDFVTIFTEFNRFNPHHRHQLQPLLLEQQPLEIFVQRQRDFEFSRRIPRIQRRFQNHNNRDTKSFDESFGVSSLRERTKDILSVVMALLFGAGCGALTAATMYLAWSLVTNRYEFVRSDEESDGDSDFEYESPKKMGYVKISSAPAPVPVAQAPATPKEVV